MTDPTTPSAPQTRGFLFADLRGYSKFTEQHGDAVAANLLKRYRDLVRREIDAYHGAEIRTEGDSFYVVFGSVSEAVQAGIGIRDAASRASAEDDAAPIRVGIGIHAGESTDGEQGIVSSAVNIAARVCAVALPGEVLVTDTVRSLTRTYLPVSFQPRGRRRLKGITDPISLFAVGSQVDHQPAGFQRTGVIGAVAATLVVAAAAVGTAIALSGGGQLFGDQRFASPSSSEGRSGTATAAPFPDAFEADLLDRLPSHMTNSCDRADRSDVPVYEDVAAPGNIGEFPLPVVAGLTCLADLTRVVYWQATSRTDVEAVFFQEVGRRGVPQATCGERTRAWQTWESSVGSGRLLCWSAQDSLLWWTYDDDPILVIASRRDGGIHDLLEWWNRTGRLLQR